MIKFSDISSTTKNLGIENFATKKGIIKRAASKVQHVDISDRTPIGPILEDRDILSLGFQTGSF